MCRELSHLLDQARKETATFKQLEREHEAELSRLEEEEKLNGGIKKTKPKDAESMLPTLPSNAPNKATLNKTGTKPMSKATAKSPAKNVQKPKSQSPPKKVVKKNAQKDATQLNKVSVPITK